MIVTETKRRNYGEITETVNGFKRTLMLSMPFDHRHPDPTKNFGVHGMELRLVLYKDDLAIHFVAYLAVHLPHVADELMRKSATPGYNPFKGTGMDVGYHSRTPQFKGQTEQDCNILGGGRCYHDDFGLRTDQWYADFLKGGPDVIWAQLEEMWNDMQAEIA